jgi:predicted NBD/HSP70 family sugar kinase
MKTEDRGPNTIPILSEKEKRSLEIFELIRRKGSISRMEISRLTHINIVSVSSYVKNFIDKGLVIEKESEVSTGGRRPELVEFDIDNNGFIGIAVKNGEIDGVLVDPVLNIVKRGKISVDNGKNSTGEIIGMIEEMGGQANLKDRKARAVGLGVSDPAAIRVDEIEKKTALPVFVAGDVLSAALAEKTKNPQADIGKLLYMHSDLGYGAILTDEYYFGATSSAGELETPSADFLKEKDGQFLEEMKYLGPWGKNISIAHLAKSTVVRGVGTKIVNYAKGNISNIDDEAVIAAAREGDDVALDLVQMASINIGLRAAYLVNLFNPSVCVIGGGFEKAGELALETIRKTVNRMALKNYAKDIKVLLSAFGKDAVSLGAASFAIRSTFINA